MTTSASTIDGRPGGRAGPAAQHAAVTTRAQLAGVALSAVVAAALYVVLGRRVTAPWILPDELIYSELAKSLAEGHLPAVREVGTLGYGVLYPLLIAPCWALFDDPSTAYAAAKVVNAVVVASAAFPAFFLARRFVSPRAALLVAAASAFLPSLLCTGTLLTEVAVYPATLLALLATVACLERPTRRNQAFAIAALALASMAKPLNVVFFAAFVASTVHLAWLERGTAAPAGRLRRQRLSLATIGCLGLVGVTVPALLGDADGVLGVYGVVLGNVDLSEVPRWFVYHLAVLDLYVAVAPFAATAILVAAALRRGREPVARVFAVVTLWSVGFLLVAVAAYSSEAHAGAEGFFPTDVRLRERNIFALVPLLLIGLALFLERRPRLRTPTAAGAAAIAVLLPFAIPLRDFSEHLYLQSFALLPWVGLDEAWPFVTLPLTAVALGSILVRSRAAELTAWVLVATTFAVMTLLAQDAIERNAEWTRTAGVGNTQWVDRALPPGSDVLAVWVEPAGATTVPLQWKHRILWMTEFFNRTVGDVVEVGAPMPYGLPHADGVATRAGLVVADRPVRASYVLAPCWVEVAGAVVAEDDGRLARVYRPSPGPIRVTAADSTRCGRLGGDVDLPR